MKPAPALRIVKDEPTVEESRDIYAESRQLWRQQDRWRVMHETADKRGPLRGWPL